jgi:hypothetical protein
MKKSLLILILMMIIALSGAFAEHPDGWGLGAGYQGAGSFSNPGYNNGFSIFLKAPQLPVYWAFSGSIRSGVTWITLTGDYYFIDKTLVPEINLGWFLGVGGYGRVLINSGNFALDLGVRVPIGLSWQPMDFLEVFADFAPSIGIWLGLGDNGGLDIGGGWQFDIGVRFWF